MQGEGRGQREQLCNRGGNRCSSGGRPHPRLSFAGTLKEMDEVGETQRLASGWYALGRRLRSAGVGAGVWPQIKGQRGEWGTERAAAAA